MSKTKNANWDSIAEPNDIEDAQAAAAEDNQIAANLAGDCYNQLTGNMVHTFAEQLVEIDEDTANQINSAITFALQDKYYRSIADIKKTTETGGTHLHGHIKRTYAQLVEVFGEPHFVYMPRAGAEDKIDREWAFKFPDGRVFTVYNWKNGKAYCGTNGLDVEDITDWNVGAHLSSTYHDLMTLLDMKLGKEQ